MADKDQLETHYNRFSSSPTTIPSAESALELESLGSIVLLVRKLREGVVASHRLDMFALQGELANQNKFPSFIPSVSTRHSENPADV